MGGMNVRDGAFRMFRRSGRRMGDVDLPRASIIPPGFGARGRDDMAPGGIPTLEWCDEKFCEDLRLETCTAIESQVTGSASIHPSMHEQSSFEKIHARDVLSNVRNGS